MRRLRPDRPALFRHHEIGSAVLIDALRMLGSARGLFDIDGPDLNDDGLMGSEPVAGTFKVGLIKAVSQRLLD